MTPTVIWEALAALLPKSSVFPLLLGAAEELCALLAALLDGGVDEDPVWELLALLVDEPSAKDELWFPADEFAADAELLGATLEDPMATELLVDAVEELRTADDACAEELCAVPDEPPWLLPNTDDDDVAPPLVELLDEELLSPGPHPKSPHAAESPNNLTMQPDQGMMRTDVIATPSPAPGPAGPCSQAQPCGADIGQTQPDGSIGGGPPPPLRVLPDARRKSGSPSSSQEVLGPRHQVNTRGRCSSFSSRSRRKARRKSSRETSIGDSSWTWVRRPSR